MIYITKAAEKSNLCDLREQWQNRVLLKQKNFGKCGIFSIIIE